MYYNIPMFENKKKADIYEIERNSEKCEENPQQEGCKDFLHSKAAVFPSSRIVGSYSGIPTIRNIKENERKFLEKGWKEFFSRIEKFPVLVLQIIGKLHS